MAERTCVVCRKVGSKTDLLRFVFSKPGSLNDGGDRGYLELRIDLGYLLPGRGAYCHRAVSCLLSKIVLERLHYSLNGGAAKKKRVQLEKLSGVSSLDSLLQEARKRYVVGNCSRRESDIVQKLNCLEKWVKSECDRVKDLRHKRGVRL